MNTTTDTTTPPQQPPLLRQLDLSIHQFIRHHAERPQETDPIRAAEEAAKYIAAQASFLALSGDPDPEIEKKAARWARTALRFCEFRLKEEQLQVRRLQLEQDNRLAWAEFDLKKSRVGCPRFSVSDPTEKTQPLAPVDLASRFNVPAPEDVGCPRFSVSETTESTVENNLQPAGHVEVAPATCGQKSIPLMPPDLNPNDNTFANTTKHQALCAESSVSPTQPDSSCQSVHAMSEGAPPPPRHAASPVHPHPSATRSCAVYSATGRSEEFFTESI